MRSFTREPGQPRDAAVFSSCIESHRAESIADSETEILVMVDNENTALHRQLLYRSWRHLSRCMVSNQRVQSHGSTVPPVFTGRCVAGCRCERSERPLLVWCG